MEIIASSTDWLFPDAERLLAFLESEAGRRFLVKLAEKTPALLPSGDTNAILIRSGEVRGVTNVIQEILALAHPTPDAPEPQNTHPALEDDRAWADGESVTTPKPLFVEPPQ